MKTCPYHPTQMIAIGRPCIECDRDRPSLANRTLVIVGCGKAKTPDRQAAQDLYTSSLFTLARMWAEKHGTDWRILSARHGLIAPTKRLDPYELTLDDLKDQGSFAWLRASIMREVFAYGPFDRLVVLAGADYVRLVEEAVGPACRSWGVPIETPLAGMGIGRRMQWLSQDLAGIGGKYDR